MDGIPKFIMVDLSACFPTNANLKRLFKKCTIAVNAMDNSMGKNNPNTGSNKVPKPKPEKSVNPDPRNATKQIMMYSMVVNLRKIKSPTHMRDLI
jgi:hypothetical protein